MKLSAHKLSYLDRTNVAAAIVTQLAPDYDRSLHGSYYVNLETGKLYHHDSRSLLPWQIDEPVVPVMLLIDDFVQVDLSVGEDDLYAYWSQFVDCYLSGRGLDSIPDDVDNREVISYCRDHQPRLARLVGLASAERRLSEISFVESRLLESITHE